MTPKHDNVSNHQPFTLTLGAHPVPGKGVSFAIWAPRARSLEVKIVGPEERLVAMQRDAHAIFTTVVPDIGPGADYLFRIDHERDRPDPVSRSQPQGVHGPSRVVDPSAFRWSDRDWRGLALEQYIIYELHVGTFTPEGTFDAAIAKLDYLRDLGVTAVELMPVAAFPGDRNWGYDGAYLYAPHEAYGGPDAFKRLVAACHRRGMAVVLDVVYNHFGPEGNYISEYAPFFSNRYRSPWGDAINFDHEDSYGVRRFFIDNACYWLTEYHVDALRLDAIHGIFDFGAKHILLDIKQAFEKEAHGLGRRAHIIAESDLNDVRVIEPPEKGGYGIDAQWSDDFHHALHTVLTGTTRGYFADFGRLTQLRKAIEDSFVYDWKPSQYRKRHHGSPARALPGKQFVICTQNHDQIPNGSDGDRHSRLLPFEAQKLAAAILLLSPNIPMLFMGQEYAEQAPFLYFTSHTDPGLAEAVSEGRRQEFASFGSDRPFADPQDPETFRKSKLRWACTTEQPHASMLRFYQDLIRLRKEHPAFANCRKDLTHVQVDEERRWLVMTRSDPSGSQALVVANVGSEVTHVPVRIADGSWNLALWSGEISFGGPASSLLPPQQLAAAKLVDLPLSPYQALVYVRSHR